MRVGSYLLPTILAIALHAVVVGLLAQSWFDHKDSDRKVPRHVQAQIVDLTTHKAQKVKAAEAKARNKAEQIRKAEAEKNRKENQRKQEVAKKKAAEKKRQQEVARKKAAAEKKRKAEVAKKKAAEKKRQQEVARKKAAAEKKRKAEVARKKAAEKKRQQEIARKKAADAKAKAAKEAAAQASANAALQQALAEEEAAIAAEEQRAAAASYEAYIVDMITRNWRRSPSARNGMVVEVTIHLLPSGRVNDRYVSKSSGDARFDNDALRAIDRVQVFEKLRNMDSVVFDRYFRKRILRFRPEDLRN
ncbi:cell envelope integrity protein TolA [uncultured Neptuniibacter sp.]|uniref:cell envelope integrity protein TolA n=1 Tax=uncultured Neptuniibacter sp. TaxID=502143 RepID=UPI002613CA57|nr:cell envelope integrity protein TolA [uncultured Neptuniibacter sp.]